MSELSSTVLAVDAVIARIRCFMEARGWSKHALCKASGVPYTTVSRMDDPDWNPQADTLRRLEAVIPPGWSPPGAAIPQTDGAAA